MPSRLSRKIVATVLAHVGVRSNAGDRLAATLNVDALLQEDSTSMRSACVEKVKALSAKKMAQYDLDHERYGHLLEQAIALDEAAVELESVSIQEQENAHADG